MASRTEGWRAPGSHVGFPHGKDKKIERRKRTEERLASKAPAAPAKKEARK